MTATETAQIDYLRKTIRDVPDFPKPGIVFRDITPILADTRAFNCSLDLLEEFCQSRNPTHIIAIESRGFIFGAPLAARMGLGLVPVRKPGKLPWKTERQEYKLEYGSDAIEIHQGSLTTADRVMIVDDLLATGGTALATCKLVERLGASVAGVAALVDLSFLPWREKLSAYEVKAFISYDRE